MIAVSEIREALRQCLNDLTLRPDVRMYLVVRFMRLNPFKAYKLEPLNEVPKQLLNALAAKVGSIYAITDQSRFKDFMGLHRMKDNDILFIEADRVNQFMTLLGIFNQHPHLVDPLPNFNQLKEIWGYAVEVETAHDRIIYFWRFEKNRLIGRADEKGKWAGKISSQGQITYLDGNILTFDESVDFIYFESLQGIIIPPSYFSFETMFSFTEAYQKETRRVLSALKSKAILVFANDEIINEALGKNHLTKKITNLSIDGFFEKLERGEYDISFFDQYSKEVPDKVSYSIAKGKVAIGDVKALKSFVEVCSYKYLGALAPNKKGEKPILFEAEDKDPLV